MSRLLRQIYLFEEIFGAFQEAFPDDPLTVQSALIDETFVTLAPAHVRAASEILVARFDFYHLSAITGQDTGAAVELLYHFWNAYGITLRAALPYTDLRIATLTDFIPGAAFYEREIYSMLGVAFEGHVNLRPLLAPDEWDGSHPLRKA